MNTNHARSWDYARTTDQPKQHPNTQPQVKVKVKKAGWITRGEKILYSLVGICMILVCYYLVSFASTTDTINRDIRAVEQQIADQSLEIDKLTYQIEVLSEPSRITRIARENGLTISSDIKQAEAYESN